MNLERSKDLVAKRKDSLRDGLPVEFPLKDSLKLLVIKDRRRTSDLRKSEYYDLAMKAIPTKKGRTYIKGLNAISLIAAVDIVFVLLVYALIVVVQR